MNAYLHIDNNYSIPYAIIAYLCYISSQRIRKFISQIIIYPYWDSVPKVLVYSLIDTTVTRIITIPEYRTNTTVTFFTK